MTPPLRLSRISLLTLAVLLGTTATAAAAARTASPTEQTKSTKSYVFKLDIGMPEHMWTPAQVKASHPKNGEVMLMGAMSGAMSMGGSSRHLEVHITSRPTGKVVANANPSITAIDTGTKDAMAIHVPIAVMEGVGEGAADLHYGNNVDLVPAHLYRVTVALKGQRAVFQMKVPSA